MAIVLIPFACSGLARAGDEHWKAEVLLASEHGLGGAAIGDLDPDSSGNEVATVNAAGEVWLVRRAGTAWKPTCIHKGDGELIMCAIGDVDPRHPGNELVGVGMVTGQESRTGPGQVLMIRKDRESWLAEQVFQDDHMIHGVAIGDVSSRHAGNEIVACGFNHRVTLLFFDRGQWQHEVIYVGNDRMKICVIADVLPEQEGDEVLVCGSDGKVVVLWEGELGWHHQLVFSDPVGQSRVATAAGRVLVGGDNGTVTLVDRRERVWQPEFIMRDVGRIRGVAIADLDQSAPGAELYACGYSKNVVQLVRHDNGFWRSKTIFTDQRPLHHLLAGDIDPARPGPELVTCGHGGRLIAISYQD
jgi:hypothetical protein